MSSYVELVNSGGRGGDAERELLALAELCDASSVNEAATRLGIDRAVILSVLRGHIDLKTTPLLERIRRHLTGVNVFMPAKAPERPVHRDYTPVADDAVGSAKELLREMRKGKTISAIAKDYSISAETIRKVCAGQYEHDARWIAERIRDVDGGGEPKPRRPGFKRGAEKNRKSALKTAIARRGKGRMANVEPRIVAVARLCDASSREEVAEQLGIARTRISELVNGTSRGDEGHLLTAIESKLADGAFARSNPDSDFIVKTWGSGNPYFVPQPVRQLAEQCDRSSRRAVAEKYGITLHEIEAALENSTGRLLSRLASSSAAGPQPRSSENREKVVAVHGAGDATAVPPWLMALADRADRTTLKEVGRDIEHSPGTISEVIAGKYKGDLLRYEADVRGRLMNEQVICPGGLGDIGTDVCMGIQRPLKSITNPLDRMISKRHCPNCPNFSKGPRK